LINHHKKELKKREKYQVTKIKKFTNEMSFGKVVAKVTNSIIVTKDRSWEDTLKKWWKSILDKKTHRIKLFFERELWIDYPKIISLKIIINLIYESQFIKQYHPQLMEFIK